MTTRNITRIHYRLANDANNDFSLWSGGVTVWRKVTKAEARAEVAKTLRVDRLPERTLVLRDCDLEAGDWTEAEIRAETTKKADAPTVKRKKKAYADVGMTPDQAEALLKQFGLK